MNDTFYRNSLLQDLDDLNVGECPEAETLHIADLEAMVQELSEAQEAGKLDIETPWGIDNLKAIVDKYIRGQ